MQRHGTTFAADRLRVVQRYLPGLTYFFKNTDIYDKEIGAGSPPAEPAAEQPLGDWKCGGAAVQFRARRICVDVRCAGHLGKDANGKLVRDRETEQYKAAVGSVRNLWSEGLIWANAPTAMASRPDFAAGHFVLSVEGFGNSWNDF